MAAELRERYANSRRPAFAKQLDDIMREPGVAEVRHAVIVNFIFLIPLPETCTQLEWNYACAFVIRALLAVLMGLAK